MNLASVESTSCGFSSAHCLHSNLSHSDGGLMAFLIWRRSRGKVENKENNRLAAIAHVLCDSKRKVQCLCGHQIAIISQTQSQHRQNKQRNFTKKSSVYHRNESTRKQPNGATKIPNKLRFIRLASNFSLFVGSWSRISSSAGAATTSSRSWTTSSAMVNRWKIAASVFFLTRFTLRCVGQFPNPGKTLVFVRLYLASATLAMIWGISKS